MDIQSFWQVIDSATEHPTTSARTEAIVAAWQVLPMLELVVVDFLLQRQLKRANERTLRTVCYLINTNNDPDTFRAFRGWLMLQGRAVFDAAIEDADTLADAVATTKDERPLLAPKTAMLARIAHKRAVGHHVPHVWSPTSDTGALPPEVHYSDNLNARFPRLMAVLNTASSVS